MSESIKFQYINGVTNVTPLFEGFQNKVYEANWNDRRIVIRLSEQTRRPLNLIQAEVEWLDYLARNDCRVAKAICPVINAIENDVPYFAVIFEHTNGRPVNVMDLDEWNADFFERWGKMIGVLHKVGAPNLSRPVWLENNEIADKVKDIPWLQKAYENSIRTMKRFKRDEHTFGLIHNDLHTGNFHLNRNGLILFDFDDCGYHFYVQDLAVSIYHALWTGTSYHPEWKDFPEQYLTALLKGYRAERKLQPDMFEQLLECLKMREIFLFTLFQESWDLQHMEDWQAMKLIELEDSIRNGKVPYERELLAMKELFYDK